MKTRIVLLIMSGLISCCSFGAKVNVNKLDSQNWIKMESQHFSVLSNASVSNTEKMIVELEDFCFFLSKLLGYTQRDALSKVPVILANSKSSFTALGIPEDYAGVFNKRDGGVIFAHSGKFRSSSTGNGNWGRTVVLHELVHLLISNSDFNFALPPWYNEGIAEYFGTYVQKKDIVMLGDMSVLRARSYSLRNRSGTDYKSVDSESLFKTMQSDLMDDGESPEKHQRYVEKFYARSLVVVHYLNTSPQRRKQMFTYLHLIKKGYSVDETFAYVFDMTFSEFDLLVDEYISGRGMMARTFPKGKGGVEFPSVESNKITISKADAMAYLYEKISLFSDRFLGEGTREKLNTDFEKLYPDFFNDS